MKILDFIFAKISRSYQGRWNTAGRASNLVALVILFAFVPPVGFILSLFPLTHLWPAAGSRTGLKIGIAIIVLSLFLFTYFRYDRAPEGYYDDALNVYPAANRRIKLWMIYLLPILLMFFWVTLFLLFQKP